MSYLGIPPFGQTIRSVTNITATAGQTTFNILGGYQQGYVDVFLNGSLLVPTTDYTATDGLTVVLTSAAALNDEFQALSYQPVSLVNVVQKTGDTMTGDLIFDTTGALTLPVGTDAERPSPPATGMVRFNDDSDEFEGYDGTAWGALGGGAVNGIFYENDQSVTTNYTIPSTKNAMSTGPITIDSGVTVTVSTGARWVVI